MTVLLYQRVQSTFEVPTPRGAKYVLDNGLWYAVNVLSTL